LGVVSEGGSLFGHAINQEMMIMSLEERIEKARLALKQREALLSDYEKLNATKPLESGGAKEAIHVDSQWNNFTNYFHNWDNRT
jgi:hypothetical protein